MKEELFKLLTLLGVGLPVACVFHFFIPRKAIATFLATVISTTLFAMVSYYRMRPVDPLFVLGVIMSPVIFFGISFAVGEIFNGKRKR